MITPIALVAVSNDNDRTEFAKTGTTERAAAAVSALELAKLLLPEEVVKAQAGGIYAALVDTLVAGQGGTTFERDHPGVSAAISFAVTNTLRRAGVARLPELWERLAAVYTSALTADEIGQALAFYRSPTGEWLLHQMRVGASKADVNRERVANPARDVVAADLDHASEGSRQTLAATMTPERKAALAASLYSPLGEKIRDLKPALRQIQLQWANAPMPEMRRQLQAVVEDTTRKFIGAETTRSDPGSIP